MGDDDRDDKKGFWYWMTVSRPSNYFLAKSLGGKASKDADKAMEDMGLGVVVLIVLFIIGGGAYLGLRLLGLA